MRRHTTASVFEASPTSQPRSWRSNVLSRDVLKPAIMDLPHATGPSVMVVDFLAASRLASPAAWIRQVPRSPITSGEPTQPHNMPDHHGRRKPPTLEEVATTGRSDGCRGKRRRRHAPRPAHGQHQLVPPPTHDSDVCGRAATIPDDPTASPAGSSTAPASGTRPGRTARHPDGTRRHSRSTTDLVVRQVPDSMSAEHVLRHFSQYGGVVKVKTHRSASGSGVMKVLVRVQEPATRDTVRLILNERQAVPTTEQVAAVVSLVVTRDCSAAATLMPPPLRLTGTGVLTTEPLSPHADDSTTTAVVPQMAVPVKCDPGNQNDYTTPPLFHSVPFRRTPADDQRDEATQAMCALSEMTSGIYSTRCFAEAEQCADRKE